ncbi:MAG: hypothetical protein JW838_14815 [Spirochaetes bacterium]|nr:hypothetical protein [Spirochaetota bacterium]
MEQSIPITVSCHAGYRGEERPVRFSFSGDGEDGKHLDVEDVLDRWQGPDYSYFKVRASDGNLYILRHDEAGDSWELEFFTSIKSESRNGHCP